MTAKLFATIPALVLALGTATALAQPAPRPFAQFDQTSLMGHGASLPPYDQGDAMAANAAFLSDGSSPSYLQDQRRLTDEPGYSIGTGAVPAGAVSASIGDGSDPSYLREQTDLVRTPGYSIGTGAAQIGNADARLGDGSNPSYRRYQSEFSLEPGYSVGTGAAQAEGTP